MQLISRIIRILQSRVVGGLINDSPDGYGRQEHHRRAAGNETGGTFQSSFNHSGFDSKLAAYYANLEVPYGSDFETIRQAWKRLVRKYHPDIHSEDPEKSRIANELTQGLNHAYEKLAEHLENKS